MRGDAVESRLLLIHAAELSRGAGDREGEILALVFSGEIGLRGINREEGRQAAAILGQRADLFRTPTYRIWARLLLARYARQQGQKAKAVTFLEEADGILMDRRVGPEAGMLAPLSRPQRRSLYELLVELLAADGRADEALDAAEKAKALMAVEVLSGQNFGANPAERDLLREETRLGELLRGLERRILKMTDEERTRELLAQLRGAEAAYRKLLARIGGEAPRLIGLVRVRGAGLPSLQGLLDDNTTLFDYFTTERGLYVWAIQRQSIHLARIELTRRELRELVLSFLDAVEKRGRSRTDSIYRKAYDLLIKPIIPFVSGERIGFIPDDSLAYLPFAAMNYRGRVLADGFTIFQIPGTRLLGQVMAGEVSSGMKILAFGDPDLEDEALDLHHAREELAQIRKRVARTTVLLQAEASEARAGEMMEGYDILHFAVRTQFHPEKPLNSGLLLTPGAGQDGTLSVLEIFRLHYPVRAVVLSGCDALPQEDPEGRGLSLLQQAFIHTGSPSVISTLWLVDDRAAAHLLDLFYQQLQRKVSPAGALRAAQLHLRREGYPPYVWAAFVLTGRY
jgi:CHAT domain-containing protein